MHPAVLLLSLASAAVADPGCIPRTSASQGFRLIVNVTDPSKDFSPSINGQQFTNAHIGPSQNRGIVVPSAGAVFYQNGTYADIDKHTLQIINDAGSAPGVFPQTVTYQQESVDTFGQGLYINGGALSGGVALSRLADPYSYLSILEGVVSSTLVVCSQTIPYYGDDRKFNVVNWVQATRDSSGTSVKVPEGCAPINLVAECAELAPLPEGAYSSHEFAQEVRCYEKVADIDWSKYSF
ncbi:hypothetical protein QBC42DRAFT_281557 [Cladorrhinum samala]|uniref:DUF7907 domain-containing protein n=1 Tax=Cladorrhinum samala TaxID=585594 RepID=A0AAV9H725_9PEZI|nr:hypothetical protein QBC42DRAFT_281557 [Cladorrhinum samala]